MPIRRRTTLAVLGLAAFAALPGRAQDAPPAVASPFLTAPYVQLGDAPTQNRSGSLTVMWHTADTADAVAGDWTVEARPSVGGGAGTWKRVKDKPASRRIAVAGAEPHRVWSVKLDGLAPGSRVGYRVLRAGKPVFEATTTARKSADQPYRFAVFGDCGVDGPEQRRIAYQTYQARPDFVMITGDIVYSRGRVSEYRTKYWPIYNAETASPETGAPLIRSTLFVAAPGNHDIGNRDLGEFPDGMAYFFYWSQPLNGPLDTPGAPNTATLSGPAPNQALFREAAGSAYPRMSNFSFDYGNAHWTVLDANTYVDWNDPALREWVRRDLEKAKNATWRFVVFHQPGFNSSAKHFNEQQMRVMAPVFEQGRVDLVFTGHVHNYQRTFPMRYQPAPGAPAKGRVPGTSTLDKKYDGAANARPEGVIYLVTGAGGAKLYDPEQEPKPDSWQEFTHKFISTVHSLTVVDVDGKKLTVRQIADDGRTIDAFTLTK